jgi:hypothetical protein
MRGFATSLLSGHDDGRLAGRLAGRELPEYWQEKDRKGRFSCMERRGLRKHERRASTQ